MIKVDIKINENRNTLGRLESGRAFTVPTQDRILFVEEWVSHRTARCVGFVNSGAGWKPVVVMLEADTLALPVDVHMQVKREEVRGY